MHFIITGGAGFIGSHLTEDLLAKGYQVTVVDNFSTGRLENLSPHPNLKLLAKDILVCNPEDFQQPIDGVAHLAATSSVTTSWTNPLTAHHNNLSATVWVIELCQRLNIPRLVYTSSAAVYGNQKKLPIKETSTTQPIAPYGWQKLFGEQYAKLFAEKTDFSFIGLRLFNVYGPRQLLSSGYSGVISIFMNSIKNNFPITIYGTGQQTRDFIYVKDVAKILYKSLIMSRDSGSSLICNIGTAKSTSLLDLTILIQKIFEKTSVEINYQPARAGDIEHSLASTILCRSSFNIEFSCLEQGLLELAKET